MQYVICLKKKKATPNVFIFCTSIKKDEQSLLGKRELVKDDYHCLFWYTFADILQNVSFAFIIKGKSPFFGLLKKNQPYQHL